MEIEFYVIFTNSTLKYVKIQRVGLEGNQKFLWEKHCPKEELLFFGRPEVLLSF